MGADIRVLRAAGLTDAQIVRVLEVEQQERNAARREQNRVNQRNYKRRRKLYDEMPSSIPNGKDEENQRPSQQVSAERADRAYHPSLFPAPSDGSPSYSPSLTTPTLSPSPLNTMSALHADAVALAQCNQKSGEQFESFWAAYPKSRNMSKSQTRLAWDRISPEDRQSAIAAVPLYIAFLRSKPDHPTVHACRFISQRRFDGFAEEAKVAEDRASRSEQRRIEAEEITRRREAERAQIEQHTETVNGSGINGADHQEELAAAGRAFHPARNGQPAGPADNPSGHRTVERMVDLFRAAGLDSSGDAGDGGPLPQRH